MGCGTPRLRVGRHTGSAVSGGGRDRAQGSGGRDGSAGRRLGGQAERGQDPPHRMGFGHRAEDPPRAPAAVAHQDFDREHAVEELGPRPPSWSTRAGVRARVVRRGRRDDRRAPFGPWGEEPVIREQGPARRGHKDGEPLQQLQRVHQERRRAVAPGPLKLIQQLAACALRQPLHGQRRPQEGSGTRARADPAGAPAPPRRRAG